MVGLETKYVVFFLSYNFIYVQNTVDIFYKSFFLVPRNVFLFRRL